MHARIITTDLIKGVLQTLSVIGINMIMYALCTTPV